ncbi:MAG: DUF885 family protein, partial [Vicinamibacteria bacterium]
MTSSSPANRSANQPPTGPFELASELVDVMASLKPILATHAGLPGHDHEWDDFSLAGAAKTKSALEEFQRRLRALPPRADRMQEVAALVMGEFIRQELDWLAQGEHMLDLNNITSTFQVMRDVFDHMDTSSTEGWRNVTARLETIDRAAAGYRSTLDEGRRIGKLVAKRQVLAAVRQ